MIHSISSADNASKPFLSRRPSAAKKSFTIWTFSCVLIEISPSALSVLDLRHASIDGEIHTGDVRTFIRGEEHDCCRNFLGHASATHWDLRGELCGRLLGLFSGKARRRR